MPAKGKSHTTLPVIKPLIALLSDFGTTDGYIGAVKGVLSRLAPGIAILDITHEIPPGDTTATRWALLNYVGEFPESTVFWAVVDPGVGTDRPPLAILSGKRYFVGPGNGIFDWVLGKGAQAVMLLPESVGTKGLSYTFHGRDLFAPAAARLALGAQLESLGEPFALNQSQLGVPKPHRDAQGWMGIVLGVDHFGNVVTNLPGRLWAGGGKLAVGRVMVEGYYRTYSDIPKGEAGVLVGSLGLLEAAMQGKSFAAESGVIAGDKVRWFG